MLKAWYVSKVAISVAVPNSFVAFPISNQVGCSPIAFVTLPRPKFYTDFLYFYTNADFSTPTLGASAQSMPTIEGLSGNDFLLFLLLIICRSEVFLIYYM